MTNLLAAFCLGLFCLLGAFDGLYFHLIRYQLHRREQSRLEHQIHTARAFLFVPIALCFFVFNVSGFLFYLGLAVILIDLGLEIVDILIEQKSREGLGGISSAECAIHVFASSFRMAALAFVISGKPMSAFTLSASFQGDPYPDYLRLLGGGFAVSSFLGGLISILAQKSDSTARVLESSA